ncbi:MAG: HDOD domain-containing protein, partial [Acidobacteriota bacterium]
ALAERRQLPGLSVDLLQEHSLMTARLAKRLVVNQRVADDAFTAGLLHDIGQIVLSVSMPDRYAEVLRTSRQRPLHEAEQEQLGVSHAEVGAYLLGVWGLPFSVVEAVAYHHRPSAVEAGDREVLAAVHVADTLVEAGDAAGSPTVGVDLAFLEASGWASALPKAREWSAATRFIEDREPARRSPGHPSRPRSG